MKRTVYVTMQAIGEDGTGIPIRVYSTYEAACAAIDANRAARNELSEKLDSFGPWMEGYMCVRQSEVCQFQGVDGNWYWTQEMADVEGRRTLWNGSDEAKVIRQRITFEEYCREVELVE